MIDNEYIQDLYDHIHNLQDQIEDLQNENARLYRENQSYKMWMNRSIERVKQMQS